MGKKLFFLAFIILWIETFAQKEHQKQIFPFDQAEIFYNSAMIMPHAPAIDLIMEEYISSFNVNLLKKMKGDKLWENLYHQPDLGLGYYYGSLGNSTIYGRSHSLYAFFEAPIWKVRNKFSLNYRMSTGLAYVTKTFDPEKNIYNIAIGSHLNLHFNLMLNTIIDLTDKYCLVSGLSFTHFSNGKVKSPNKGLNVINGSVGLRHFFRGQNLENREFSKPTLDDKNHFSLIWSHGLKDYNRFMDASYYISSLNMNYERQYAHVAKAGLGVDAFYNSSLKNLQDNPLGSTMMNKRLYRLGIHLSHDIIVGDFSLAMQIGHYIYNKAFYITDIYNRIGLRYYSNDQIILNLSLKSHNANAEFIELGIGYLW